MPDETLHGNHDPCPACELQRQEQDLAPIDRIAIRCQLCGGTGWIALSAREIVARTAAEACRIYWPVFDERNGL